MLAIPRATALLIAVLAASVSCTSDDGVTTAPDGGIEAPPLPAKVEPAAPDPVANETDAAAVPPEPVTETVPVVDERPFVPEAGARLRYVGRLRSAHGEELFVEVRDRFAAAGDGALDLFRTTRVGPEPGAWGEAVSERYRLVSDGESLRVGLAPDEFRDVPPPTTVLVLPPEVGSTWSLGANTHVDAKILEIGSARTVAGEVADAAKIELRPHDATWIEHRWYARGTGLVRVERRDASGKLLLGLALASDAAVDEATIRALLAD